MTSGLSSAFLLTDRSLGNGPPRERNEIVPLTRRSPHPPLLMSLCFFPSTLGIGGRLAAPGEERWGGGGGLALGPPPPRVPARAQFFSALKAAAHLAWH